MKDLNELYEAAHRARLAAQRARQLVQARDVAELGARAAAGLAAENLPGITETVAVIAHRARQAKRHA